MNRITIKFLGYILVGVTICAAVACNKLIEIPPNPSDQLLTGQVFSDSENVVGAIAGIYQGFSIIDDGSSPSFFNGGIPVYTGMSSDELINHDIFLLPYQTPYYVNALLPNDPYVAGMWAAAYAIIYRVNAALEGITESKGVSESFRSRTAGELRTVRAFCYFNLLNLYGGVPMITGTDFNMNARVPRSTVEEVYQFIIDEMEEAVDQLLPEYPSEGRARPNLHTAKALLAKAYLYTEDWQKSAALSGEVIDAGVYSLETDLNNVFVKGSAEAIWQYPTEAAEYYQTNDGYLFIPYPEEIPRFEITEELYHAFEADDQRKINWIGQSDVDGTVYNFPYKYKNMDSYSSDIIEDYMMLRLAEQYLIRAEARAELDQYDDALDDLNIIRERAGLEDVSFTDKEALLTAIMHERQVELFCEWGNRWFDLKRRGIADAVLGSKSGWQSTDALYPIPLNELRTNPFLDQNAGY